MRLPQEMVSLNSLFGLIVTNNIIPATVQQTIPLNINVQKLVATIKLQIDIVTIAEIIMDKVYSAYLPKYLRVVFSLK